MIEVQSLNAVELYNMALRTIVLASLYSPDDIGWAVARLRQEQASYTRNEGDWQAYESIIAAILAAAAWG